MRKVVLVGDRPSLSNISPNIPFVGAKCFEVLVDWIATLKIDYYIVQNSVDFDDLNNISLLYKNGFSVVALGNAASERLQAFKIAHFKLPHPSGLNRQINDDHFIGEQLALCDEYLEEKERYEDNKIIW